MDELRSAFASLSLDLEAVQVQKARLHRQLNEVNAEEREIQQELGRARRALREAMGEPQD